jgi:alpha-ketoglutarate-dependent taurine dioxygenase
MQIQYEGGYRFTNVVANATAAALTPETNSRFSYRTAENNSIFIYLKTVHSFTAMMNMKLTTTAFERNSRPATTALEESLREDDRLAPMQQKRMRYSLEEGDKTSNKSSPYGMLGFWRELEDLEHTSAFPTIEWSFDNDIRVANERGSTSNHDVRLQKTPESKYCVSGPCGTPANCLLSSKNTVEQL